MLFYCGLPPAERADSSTDGPPPSKQKRTPSQRSCGRPPSERADSSTDGPPPSKQKRTPSQRSCGPPHSGGRPPSERADSSTDGPPPSKQKPLTDPLPTHIHRAGGQLHRRTSSLQTKTDPLPTQLRTPSFGRTPTLRAGGQFTPSVPLHPYPPPFNITYTTFTLFLQRLVGRMVSVSGFASTSSHGIKQTFAPPFHPQSNGCAERFVDTLKRQMKKCARDDPHWVQNSLLAYRTTPNASLNGRTPAELFLGRPENLDIDNQAQGEQQPETPNRSPRRVRFADEPLEQIQPIEPRRSTRQRKAPQLLDMDVTKNKYDYVKQGKTN
ncbi:hypothetical protein niasHT_023583 [Heterodera trifolii]|uniref:Integrase catalytic domain-containing protein n=1 Tax=Heterodera trifolii TaxID=157864 RepID=A0ABD2JBA8_9BILA